LFWRWDFPTGSNSALDEPRIADSHRHGAGGLRCAAGNLAAFLLNTVVPGECNWCKGVIRHARRIPYCTECLALPLPLHAEHYCSRCRTPFQNDATLDARGVCLRCRSGLPGFDYVYSFGFFDGVLRSMVHDLKYSRVSPLGGYLGELMARAIPLDLAVDAIVPVPIHWTRWIKRGYNQAELLARPLARRMQIPILSPLRRKRTTRSQVSLTVSERRKNLAGAFSIRDRSLVADKRVLLVDDVLTTGATIGYCSRLLRDAGARSVTVVTLARVDRRPSPARVVLTASQASGGMS